MCIIKREREKEMTDKEYILKLKDGESYIVPESDYGKAEIWFKHGTYFLFEIPTFGGKPAFFREFLKYEIDHMIKIYSSWT